MTIAFLRLLESFCKIDAVLAGLLLIYWYLTVKNRRLILMPWPSCGNGWALSLLRGKSTASAAGLAPALKHRGNERRVSAERKAYGVRLVFSSRSVRHKRMFLVSILHQHKL